MSEALSFPSDWDERPIGELGEVKLGRQRAPRFVLGNAPKPYLRVVNISEGKLDLRDVKRMDFIGSDFHVYQLQHGDVLLTEGDLGSAFNVGRTAVYRDEIADCCYTNTLIRFRKFDGESPSEYYHYVFELLRQFGMFARTTAATTVYHLSSGRLKKVLAPVAPVPEQRKIARILTTLDKLIEKTEALIAKYQAIIQGMMHDLFTRGVDSSGQLRPTQEQAPDLYKQSELGWIPKEWDVRRVCEVSEMITSGSRGWAEFYSETGAIFVRIGNLTREHINFRWNSIQRVSPPMTTEGRRTRLQVGDVLVSVTADLGIIAVVPPDFEEAYINQHIAMVRCRAQAVNPRWLGRALASFHGQRQFERQTDTGAKAGLNLGTVASLQFPHPSVSEQELVTQILDRAESTINSEIAQLKKYRQTQSGLMQDLLTGKVRVKVDEAEEVATHA